MDRRAGLGGAAVRQRRRAARARSSRWSTRRREADRLALIRAHPDLAGKAAIAGELTPESTREQSAAGLDRLTPEQYARHHRRSPPPTASASASRSSSARASTPPTRSSPPPRRASAADPDREERTALSEIAKIARLRLDDLVDMSGARISYGKLAVPVQCVGVAPLRGLPEIPESPVRALDTGLLACEVSMEVLGQRLPRRLHGGRQPRRRRDGHDEERDPAPRARLRRRRAGGPARRARPALPRAPTRRWRGCG